MSIKRTLWDFLDNSPAPPAVVDGTDEDVEGVYFEQARTQTRWRVGITALMFSGRWELDFLTPEMTRVWWWRYRQPRDVSSASVGCF